MLSARWLLTAIPAGVVALLVSCSPAGSVRTFAPGTDSDVPVIAGLADSASEAAAGSLVSLGGRDIALPAQVRRLASRVARGATLSSLLHAHQVAEQEIAALIAGTSAVFDVRALRTDRPYRIVQAIEGQLKRFEYEIDNDRVLTVARNDDDEFVAAIDAIEKRTAATRITGAIDREAPSLFAAMARTGERVDLSMALADVLSSEIDFNTELQPGDHFGILFEKQFRDDGDLIVRRVAGTSGQGVPETDKTLENDGDAFAGAQVFQ